MESRLPLLDVIRLKITLRLKPLVVRLISRADELQVHNVWNIEEFRGGDHLHVAVALLRCPAKVNRNTYRDLIARRSHPPTMGTDTSHVDFQTMEMLQVEL